MSLGGECAEYPRCTKGLVEKIEYFVSTLQYRDLDNNDGEPVVFERKISPGPDNTGSATVSQELVEKEPKFWPQKFRGPHHQMSMSSDIDWTRNGNQEVREETSSRIALWRIGHS